MSLVVRMPKMSDTMKSGVIVSWLKKEGDFVKSNDVIAEINTDKAVMDLESGEDGFILHIVVKENQIVFVNEIIAVIGNIDDNYKEIISNDFIIYKSDFNIFPFVRKVSKIKNNLYNESSLSKFTNNNKKNNNSNKFNIENNLVNTNKNHFKESYFDTPISNMRMSIANKLSQSKFIAPHFYLNLDVIADSLIEFKKSINLYSNLKISFNDIILKASSIAIQHNPKINSMWLDDKIRYNNHIHIGFAVSLNEGLLVPVLRFVNHKSISVISNETKELIKISKAGKFKPELYSKSTFTISNLGMFGIDSFTSIINPPSSCILSIGSIKNIPLVKNGSIVSGNIINLSLSCDHRVIDGLIAVKFLNTLKEILENPFRIFI